MLILNRSRLQTVSHSHRPEGEDALLMRGQRRPVQANRVATSKRLVQQQCEKRHLRINIDHQTLEVWLACDRSKPCQVPHQLRD